MKCAGFSRKIIVALESLSRIFVTRLVCRAIRASLLSYPDDFSYRANVLATSLDIN